MERGRGGGEGEDRERGHEMTDTRNLYVGPVTGNCPARHGAGIMSRNTRRWPQGGNGHTDDTRLDDSPWFERDDDDHGVARLALPGYYRIDSSSQRSTKRCH